MTHGGKALACILGGLALCTGTTSSLAAPAENPYQGIVDRNVFTLKAPPPPPDPNEVKAANAPKITLTGIMTIFGKKQALMKTPPLPPSKPGEQPREQSYMLAEGQRDGDIEVLHIDERAGLVKVSNSGSIQTLSFTNDGVKLATSPLPLPGGAPGGIPAPAGFGTPGSLPGGFKSIPPRPTRTLTLPTPGAATGTSSGISSPQSATSTGYVPPPTFGGAVALPAVNSSASAAYAQNPGAAAPANLTPEQQTVAIATIYKDYKNKNDPRANLMPPTALTPGVNTTPRVGDPNLPNNQNPNFGQGSSGNNSGGLNPMDPRGRLTLPGMPPPPPMPQ